MGTNERDLISVDLRCNRMLANLPQLQAKAVQATPG
jgi:hypothetical protein